MKGNNEAKQEEVKKMLGAFVPETVYWAFKKVAAQRQEDMQEAILNAAYLYLDAEKEVKTVGQE